MTTSGTRPNPTPELAAKIAQEDYSDQERRNIESTIAFINLHPDERLPMLADDFTLIRHGMVTAQRLWGLTTPGHASQSVNDPFTSGYTSQSMNNRVDCIEDIIAKGDRVWVLWRLTGNHTGPWFGVEGTGKPLEFREEAHLRFRDGKVVEARFEAEELAMAEQLGIRWMSH